MTTSISDKGRLVGMLWAAHDSFYKIISYADTLEEAKALAKEYAIALEYDLDEITKDLNA